MANTDLLNRPTQEMVTSFFEKLPEIRASYENDQAFYAEYQNYFNCYGLAAGSVGNPFITDDNGNQALVMAIPGALSGEPMTLFTAEEMHRATIADGFDPIEPIDYEQGAENLTREGYTLVAAFIDPIREGDADTTFHYAVRNNQGDWIDKNGMSEIKNTTIENTPYRDPHQHPEDFLTGRLDFVGYYWRPNEGINVTAGKIPVSAFDNAGTIVTEGTYDPEAMKNDVWAGNDYIATSFEVSDAHLEPLKTGDYRLSLVDEFGKHSDPIILPSDLVFNRAGNKTLAIDDPSGPDLTLIMPPEGTQHIQESEPYVEERSGTPFKM